MDRFGMDLGTTNSAVCYYNPERKAFEFLKLGTQTLDFFPTVIAYHKDNDSERYIGEVAKSYQFKQDYDVYSLFKLSLGEDAHKAKGRRKTPYQVTKDFIAEVIKAFCEKTGQKELNNLVLTVPDVWKNEDKNKIAVDHLMQIFNDLGWDAEDRVALESEPVSAVAYYCREVCKTPYQGYVVVIDYGGGTLDLTLCRVDEDGRITVLRRCGDGGEDGIGCAGAAFDTALTNRLVEKYHINLGSDGRETLRFQDLRNRVESAKISFTQQTTAALQDYYNGYDAYARLSYSDRKAFEVPDRDPLEPGYTVMASDVVEVFEEVNTPALNRALDTMKGYCEELKINTGSTEAFRVLMVGGFSNLYCVESACRKAFESEAAALDRRFDDRMRQFGRCSTAIAHGAALIAAGMAKIEYNCQSDVGFFYYDPCSETEKIAAVIRRDTPVRDYQKPKYFDGIMSLDILGTSSSIRLFFDDGNGVVPITMDKSFRDLCPNADRPGNTYRIGFSMGRHRIPVLHFKDKSGEVSSHSLNKIISKIALRLAPENPKGQEE